MGLNLVGYCDPLTVAPGEAIRFMVSCAHPSFRADVVRLIHGDPNPNGPGFKETEVLTTLSGEYPGRMQTIATGSRVVVPDAAPLRLLGSLALQAWIFPTTPGQGAQGILGKWASDPDAGYGLLLDETGALTLRLGDGMGGVERISAGAPLRAGRWYFVAARFDAASGRVTLIQEPVFAWPLDASNRRVDSPVDLRVVGSTAPPLVMAGDADAGSFNGKIDRPRLFDRALTDEELENLKGGQSPLAVDGLVAAWDFSREISSSRVIDTGPHALHGTAVNCPARGITGANWTGRELSCVHAPEEYGAIHFHDDDLEDAGWEPGLAFTVPGGFPSGIYALRLRAGADDDRIPFFVRPQPGTTTASVAFLAPTLTYLAYANEHMPAEPVELFPFLDLDAHATEYRYIAEHGLHSLYDIHRDGSGVCYASWKRPLVNLRPQATFRIFGSPERFGADLYLIDWLEHKQFPYDIITDEILHADGVSLLEPYRVVVTGTHPEYWTGPMLDALAAYLSGGGRVMYLGGNGFYWVTGIDSERPHVIEIRRWRGTESWEVAPGEFTLSTTGEPGGLWRHRNRAPQKLLGVGFTAQGNDYSRPYFRQSDSCDPRAAFVFAGIADDEPIGDFPSLMLRHGAAGYEIDRMDEALGTPPHALLLATATGFSDSYQHVIEEVLTTDNQQGGSVDPDVRADMVFFEGPNGGAVFSVGSIAWCGALSFNDYDNTVSRVTENVLRQFLDEEAFPTSSRGAPEPGPRAQIPTRRVSSHQLTIRPATAADLPVIQAIRYESAAEIPPLSQRPPPYLHVLLESGCLLVTECAGTVIGYAGLAAHGDFAYLTDLFIKPARQSASAGSALLREILPTDGTLLCTMASTDHRAVALYARAGMRPRWPNYVLDGQTGRLGDLGGRQLEVVPAETGDPAIVAWDAAASGRARPAEHAFWVGKEGGVPLWFKRDGDTAGYGFVRPHASSYGPGRMIAVGPIGVKNARDAADCVVSAVAWAREKGPAGAIEMSVPGPHPALTPLLEAGFRITYVETFCASGADDVIDPRRYVGSGTDLF